MASGSAVCIITRLLSGVTARTMPAPLFNTAAADSSQAPAIPRLPAIRSTLPKVPLFPSWSLTGRNPLSSLFQVKIRGYSPRKPSCVIPISAQITFPAYRAPGYKTSPSLRNPKVTVTSACTAQPITSPVSPWMPEGISTERT